MVKAARNGEPLPTDVERCMAHYHKHVAKAGRLILAGKNRQAERQLTYANEWKRKAEKYQEK
jgi:hypothetical protein